jgi:hypothetical protein
MSGLARLSKERQRRRTATLEYSRWQSLAEQWEIASQQKDAPANDTDLVILRQTQDMLRGAPATKQSPVSNWGSLSCRYAQDKQSLAKGARSSR